MRREGRGTRMGQKRQSGTWWGNLKGLSRRRLKGDDIIEMDTKK